MIRISKKLKYIFFLTGLAILFFFIFNKDKNDIAINFNSEKKKIELTDSNITFELMSAAKTVEDFMNEQKIVLEENDLIVPDKNKEIFSGTHIIIKRAKNITIKEADKKTKTHTLLDTIEQAVWENKEITLSDDDITNPSRRVLVKEEMTIIVTHVVIKEEIKKQDIDFKTISNEDDKLGWRVKKVTQKGIKGTREIKYKVVYHDNKEISRKILESNVTKEPIEEIVTQGTYMKLGKANKGQGTWYAWKGGLFAASTTLPRGAYAKVTNAENGKSVVVQINDYGPQGKGRIIDLDKVAFEKIASLGAGVIGVKVEQVLN
ncbi:MAG TPA: G5 domain-containing protein [Candidatus Moranbacteria bacterium]|nr:G5 domain-containing protein [Candidatus Moranbacteria bacterium]HRZ33525.1 G5 domain-containing protein [Candidatus Moranbacteria bacterium]